MIETPRLLLRQWRDADRPAFAAMSADTEVMRYFPGVQTTAEADALIDRAAAHIGVHGWGMWAVERRDDGEFAGIVGLQPCTARGPVLGEVEIGWRIDRRLWRQGYALEAAAAALAFALANLRPRIVAVTARLNVPSQALMRRLGLAAAPGLDFDSVALAAGHRLRPHVTFITPP